MAQGPCACGKKQGITKEALPTIHDVEGGLSSTCRERSETGSSLEAFEHQRVCLGICVEHRWRIIFRTLSTDLEALSEKAWRDVSVKTLLNTQILKVHIFWSECFKGRNV